MIDRPLQHKMYIVVININNNDIQHVERANVGPNQ